MNVRKLILLLVLAVSAHAVSAQKLKTLQHIKWLAGKWEMEGKKGNIYEEWSLIDDLRMEGKSYKVYKKDTTLKESLLMTIEGEEIWYTATVKDQNNGEPVRFRMTDGSRRRMEFENKEHDFPQQIVYQWKQNDHFNAEVSGLIKGKKKTQLFVYKKID
jgi:hypothetical protein